MLNITNIDGIISNSFSIGVSSSSNLTSPITINATTIAGLLNPNNVKGSLSISTRQDNVGITPEVYIAGDTGSTDFRMLLGSTNYISSSFNISGRLNIHSIIAFGSDYVSSPQTISYALSDTNTTSLAIGTRFLISSSPNLHTNPPISGLYVVPRHRSGSLTSNRIGLHTGETFGYVDVNRYWTTINSENGIVINTNNSGVPGLIITTSSSAVGYEPTIRLTTISSPNTIGNSQSFPTFDGDNDAYIRYSSNLNALAFDSGTFYFNKIDSTNNTSLINIITQLSNFSNSAGIINLFTTDNSSTLPFIGINSSSSVRNGIGSSAANTINIITNSVSRLSVSDTAININHPITTSSESDIGINTSRFGTIFSNTITTHVITTDVLTIGNVGLSAMSPVISGLYTLGSTSARWNNIFTNTISGGGNLTISAPSGTVSVTENLVTESVLPTTNLTYDLGSSSNVYNNLYVGNVISGSLRGRVFTNRLINPSMTLSQRVGTGVVTVNSSTRTYGPDRWFGVRGAGATGTFTIQTSTDVPVNTNLSNSLLVTVTNTGTGDYNIGQLIEANNISDVLFGTSSARSLVLSFWVKCSISGIHSVTLRGVDRRYIASFTVSVANTWEFKTINITPCTDGTWNSGISNGLGVRFIIGSSNTSTANVWSSNTTDDRALSGVNLIGTLNATFQITGCQLEVGTNSNGYEFRPYHMELELCQRYYEKTYLETTAINTITNIGSTMVSTNGSGTFGYTHYFKITKRTIPTITFINPVTGVSGSWRSPGGNNGSLDTTAGLGGGNLTSVYQVSFTGSGFNAASFAFGHIVIDAEY